MICGSWFLDQKAFTIPSQFMDSKLNYYLIHKAPAQPKGGILKMTQNGAQEVVKQLINICTTSR